MQHDEEEYIDQEEDRQEDAEYTRDKSYISEQVPTDQFRYKQFRIKPNAETDFRGLIDKDLVLSNLNNVKPDPGYLQEVTECMVLIQQEFVIEKEIVICDEAGNVILNGKGMIRTKRMKVFDENFQPCLSFLLGIFKFQVNSSRAMGKDREAILDKSEFIGKSSTKIRGDQQRSAFGVGGNKS